MSVALRNGQPVPFLREDSNPRPSRRVNEFYSLDYLTNHLNLKSNLKSNSQGIFGLMFSASSILGSFMYS